MLCYVKHKSQKPKAQSPTLKAQLSTLKAQSPTLNSQLSTQFSTQLQSSTTIPL